jgi:signal transduction histidine kinase/CheY-like chemotaxis protein
MAFQFEGSNDAPSRLATEPEGSLGLSSAESITSRNWNINGVNISDSLRRALDVCEAAFDDIVDKSADGVLVVNPAGTICFANAAAESMLGCATGELLGEPIGLPISPGQTFEMNLPSGDQKVRTAEVRVVATNWQGVPAHLATLRDVTQRNEALRRRDEFLAILSHELRNPLAAISNAASVLARLDLRAETFTQARQVIERQCTQMTRLLADLLDVSRAARSKIELRVSCLDLVDVVIEAADAVRGEIDSAGQELSIHCPDDLVPVEGDAVRLHQVFVNLLSNASKFSGEGSLIELTVAIEGAEAVVRVRDQGIGLSPETLQTVFQPFVQLGSALDRGGEGLGLGLAIVDGLVKLHSGTVQALSEGHGKGTEFCVRLPRSNSLPTSEPARKIDPNDEPLRIAVVEDNADVRSMLAMLLEYVGHQVEVAGDGPSGVELIERMRPDVAFVDIGLPQFDGYQLARRIRANDDCRDVYLAALTGYGQPADQEKALSSGFDAHLSKPVSMEQLRKILSARRQTLVAAEPLAESRTR